jgi:hypothetical protein
MIVGFLINRCKMSSADNLVAFVTFLKTWPAINKMKRSSSQNWYESEYCEKTEALSDQCDDDWDETALKAACFALAWLGSCLIISQLGHWTTAHSNCCVLVVQNRSKSLRAICKVCSTQPTPVSAHSAPRWTLYLESLSTTDDLIMSEMAPKKTGFVVSSENPFKIFKEWWVRIRYLIVI